MLFPQASLKMDSNRNPLKSILKSLDDCVDENLESITFSPTDTRPLSQNQAVTETNCTLLPTGTKITISFCYLNIRSILTISDDGLPRIDHLRNFACIEHKSDIILLTESKLDSSIDDTELEFDDYIIFRLDRNRSGGGVCLYARKQLSPVLLSQIMDNEIESVYIKLLCPSISCIFGVCYRPPNQLAKTRDMFFDALRKQLDYLCFTSKCPFLLFGDFNDACSQWKSDHCYSEIGLSLYNIVKDYSLSQVVNKPTRGINILDLIITNDKNFVCDHFVVDPIDNLDHSAIIGSVKSYHTKQSQYNRYVRHFTTESLNVLNSNLLSLPWHALLSNCADVNDCVSELTGIVSDALDIVIPSTLLKVRPRDKPGMNDFVRKLFKNTHKLHRLATLSKDATDLENHRNARRIAKKAWYQAQKHYHEKIYKNSNSPGGRSKAFWKILKSNFSQKKHISVPTLTDGLANYTTDLSKATLLNEYFASQSFLNLALEPDLPKSVVGDMVIGIRTVGVSVETVRSLLKTLDVNKATGPDGIGNKILKHCADSLCTPIAIVAQLSLDQGIFPLAWKMSHVVPIFKKGAKNDKCNYRPISLLCNLSKVLERIVYNHLYNYFVSNNLLSTKNSGFKKGDGAINQLLCMTDNIYRSFEASESVALIFLDISKAFDRVWHKGLIYKLSLLGVGGPLLLWLESYLNERSQRVVLSGQTSPTLKTNAGVPQGSILGPLLFLVFINDIETNIMSNMYIFADDATLAKSYVKTADAEMCLNRDLLQVSEWAKKWMVTFNSSKTVFVDFSLKHANCSPKLIFDGSLVTKVSDHKHLGITLSEDMKWSKHITLVTRKAHQRLGVLYRQSSKLSRLELESFYLNMIRPILEYGSVLLCNLSLTDINRLENVQRRAAVICTGAMRRTESTLLMTETNWDSLEIRRKKTNLTRFFLLCNASGPSYLLDRVSFVQGDLRERRSYYFRHNKQVKEQFCRLECAKNSFFPHFGRLWNNLRSDIVNTNSISLFKKNLIPLFGLKPSKNLSHSYSHICTGKTGKLLTQFRLGLSPLKNDLFRYNIIDNPFCPSCGDEIETLSHFFFKCKSYSAQRVVLLKDITQTIDLLQIELHLGIKVQDESFVLDLLISGTKNLLPLQSTVYKLNENIFRLVSRYISTTKRFCTVTF